MVQPDGPRSVDHLPLALAVAGLKPAGPSRVTQGALSVVERPLVGDASARRALLNAREAGAREKKISALSAAFSPSLHSAHCSSLSLSCASTAPLSRNSKNRNLKVIKGF